MRACLLYMLAHSELQLTHPAFRDKASTTETTRCACTSGASSSCNASLRRPPFAKYGQRAGAGHTKNCQGTALNCQGESAQVSIIFCVGISRKTLPFYACDFCPVTCLAICNSRNEMVKPRLKCWIQVTLSLNPTWLMRTAVYNAQYERTL